MNKNILIVLLYALITILMRTSLHLGPNIETVTAFTLLAAFILPLKQAAISLLSVMLVTDLLLGNTNIFLFTWTGFLFPLLLGKSLIGKNLFVKNAPADLLISSLVSGILSTLIFFVWTNFGVVLVTELYPKTLSGLISSYINALPFLRMQLAGNMVFVPLFMISAKYLLNSKGFIKEKLQQH